jgi:asparagine synthase (glutamine-hydrolysing)
LIKQRLAGGGRFQSTPELAGAVAAGLVDPGYASPDSFKVVRSFLDPLDRAHPDCDQLTRMIACEFQLRLPELLLMRVDKICMSTTIEARVPFLDHELIEFTMDIPQRSKIRSNVAKQLLKRSVEGWIPSDTIRRKKMGFDAPMSQWLRGEFGRRVESQLATSRLMNAGYFDQTFVKLMCREHRDAVRDHSLCIWTLFNVAAWYDYWIEGRAH